jgi:hypothetical protein
MSWRYTQSVFFRPQSFRRVVALPLLSGTACPKKDRARQRKSPIKQPTSYSSSISSRSRSSHPDDSLSAPSAGSGASRGGKEDPDRPTASLIGEEIPAGRLCYLSELSKIQPNFKAASRPPQTPFNIATGVNFQLKRQAGCTLSGLKTAYLAVATNAVIPIFLCLHVWRRRSEQPLHFLSRLYYAFMQTVALSRYLFCTTMGHY